MFAFMFVLVLMLMLGLRLKRMGRMGRKAPSTKDPEKLIMVSACAHETPNGLHLAKKTTV